MLMDKLIVNLANALLFDYENKIHYPASI